LRANPTAKDVTPMGFLLHMAAVVAPAADETTTATKR
jgi:hypothetical protein